jgi:hypothetical protein
VIVAGLLALVTGLAYTALGIITGYELLHHRRTRGYSHFGLAFLVMAFTCGPHHLVHAWRHLVEHEPAHGPMIASLALGLGPGVVFVGLRVEALLGGRGDRLVQGSNLFSTIPWLMAAAGGATLFETLRHASMLPIDLRALIPNLILFVNYALVGYFTARSQLSRHPVLGGWSLSGVAMSGVFLTCGLTHLVDGLLSSADFASIVLDNLGVPASIYFLWAVHKLYRDSLGDWNRRPLVGRAAPLGRPSPWAETSS